MRGVSGERSGRARWERLHEGGRGCTVGGRGGRGCTSAVMGVVAWEKLQLAMWGEAHLGEVAMGMVREAAVGQRGDKSIVRKHR